MVYKKESLESMLLENLKTNEELMEEWESDPRYEDESMSSKFWDTIRKASAVAVVGDYDVDGICASYIMGKSVKAVCPDKKLFLRIPRRFSEGYGISDAIADEIMSKYPPGTAIVTVDNGIAASDVLERLEAAGYPVLMTDHHVLTEGKRVPNVTFAVDPCVEEISNGFSYKGWCGAAVAFKLCERYVPKELAKELECFAGLATVTDGMDLKEANWGLVKRTIRTFREGKAPVALSNIAAALKQDPLFVDEDTFGWYIGPCLNAPGRLEDKGGSLALSYLFSPTTERLEQMVAFNKSRKEIRDIQLDQVVKVIEEEGKENDCPIWVAVPGLHMGIIGVLAGKIAEKYGVPAIVGTFLPDRPDMVKASGRTAGGINLLRYLELIPKKENCPAWYEKLGGHAGAGVVVMEYENFEASSVHQLEKPECVKYESIEISPSDIGEVNATLTRFKPFGKGNAIPTFSMEFDFNKDGGRMVGDEKNHLIAGPSDHSYKIQHFHHDPNSLSNKEHFGMVGKVVSTAFNGVETPTFDADGVFDLCVERTIETDAERDVRSH